MATYRRPGCIVLQPGCLVLFMLIAPIVGWLVL